MRVKASPPPRPARIITVRRKPGHPTRALLTFAGRTEEAAIGRGGITSRKREGDGGTPIAAMRLVGGYVRHDRGISRAQTRLPLRFTPQNLLWCDEPGHALYNRPVTAPFKASHEKMRRDDGLYDVCIVMDWNLRQRKRFGGSAIFFHIAKPGYPPTEGCVAISLPAMQRLLHFIGRETVLKVLV
jgi:L,D-peptidoglycan transpeptidase YkuD (ErfK/YbiS/YcfS/YnhG family)